MAGQPTDESQNTSHTITKFDDFWETSDPETHNDYSFLSNFYILPNMVSIDLPWTGEMRAQTTEHLYAAAKAMSVKSREEILQAASPGRAKMIGRRCHMVDFWTEVKLPVMRCCIEAKFPEGSGLAAALMSTFPMNLREGTTWGDKIWGVDITRDGHVGQNLLGMLLMDHRSRLMDGLPPIGYIGLTGSWEVRWTSYV